MTGGTAGGGGFGPVQLRKELGVSEWQLELALRRELLPGPDVWPASGPRRSSTVPGQGGRWSGELVARMHLLVPGVLEVVGEAASAGTRRMAERLAAVTGLEVAAADVETMAEHGHLAACGEYKGWPLYLPVDVDALAGPALREELERRVGDRLACEAVSVTVAAACERLVAERGWRPGEARDALAARGLVAGGRVRHADLAALLADEDLAEQVTAARTLGPDQAAAHLEIRRSDFEHLRRAGLVHQVDEVDVRLEHGRGGGRDGGRGSRWVTVPLFALGDLDALRRDPPAGLDWELVRGVRPGQRSPLLDTP